METPLIVWQRLLVPRIREGRGLCKDQRQDGSAWVVLGKQLAGAPGDGDEFEDVVSCGRRPVACRPDGASIADQRTARTRGSREPAKSLSCAS
jgi:hypothetical protein